MRDAILAAAPYLAVGALLFGPAAAWLAARRQRNPAVWLMYGALLGPVALALLLAAPPARCPACSEATEGFDRTCSTCGFALLSPGRAGSLAGSGAAADGRTEPPVLRSVPGLSSSPNAGSRSTGVVPRTVANAAQPDRLSALGLRRGGMGPSAAADAFGRSLSDVTLLAIGVFVRGSEPLLPGARYLIARTHDRLLIIGPLEPSDEQVQLDLPLAGVEANFIPDRLVISGAAGGKAARSFVLAFQSVAGMTATPVDEAIMGHDAPIPIAAGRP